MKLSAEVTTVLIGCSVKKRRVAVQGHRMSSHLLHGLETDGAQESARVSLLESDECLSFVSGNFVPLAAFIGSFDLMDQLTLRITEFDMAKELVIVCSHPDNLDGPVLRELK